MRDDDLLADVMAWLADADSVASHLQYAAVGQDIVVSGQASETTIDPFIFVGVAESASARQNETEEKAFDVRVGVFASNDWVGSAGGSVFELTQLKARVKDTLTTGRNGWTATGVQSDEEVQPVSDPDGYLGVAAFGYEASGLHAHYRG